MRWFAALLLLSWILGDVGEFTGASTKTSSPTAGGFYTDMKTCTPMQYWEYTTDFVGESVGAGDTWMNPSFVSSDTDFASYIFPACEMAGSRRSTDLVTLNYGIQASGKPISGLQICFNAMTIDDISDQNPPVEVLGTISLAEWQKQSAETESVGLSNSLRFLCLGGQYYTWGINKTFFGDKVGSQEFAVVIACQTGWITRNECRINNLTARVWHHDQEEALSQVCDSQVTPGPTSEMPTPAPTTRAPTRAPTTRAPTRAPTTRAPTPAPTTRAPTPAPSSSPAVTPAAPTKAPTTNSPTAAPSKSPTFAPSKSPTFAPTKSPTFAPTKSPTFAPTKSPTFAPTKSPTFAPTKSPTFAPTKSPTFAPSKSPTFAPSSSPTVTPDAPTKAPTTKSPTTVAPSKRPTAAPSKSPTAAPSKSPTVAPSKIPTSTPTKNPSSAPTKNPTSTPTKNPSSAPTTQAPSVQPSASPTVIQGAPTKAPTTRNPSVSPSSAPTAAPSAFPTSTPTASPSSAPTVAATTVQPSASPSSSPSAAPSAAPTGAPTALPTSSAPTSGTRTAAPSSAPSSSPSSSPSAASAQPTALCQYDYLPGFGCTVEGVITVTGDIQEAPHDLRNRTLLLSNATLHVASGNCVDLEGTTLILRVPEDTPQSSEHTPLTFSCRTGAATFLAQVDGCRTAEPLAHYSPGSVSVTLQLDSSACSPLPAGALAGIILGAVLGISAAVFFAVRHLRRVRLARYDTAANTEIRNRSATLEMVKKVQKELKGDAPARPPRGGGPPARPPRN